MNKSNLTRLIINLRASAECARDCGMLETAEWLRSVAELCENRHPELYVK